ncbi:MAG: hypothetical protein IT581_20305 [Verrucomicrobiales bacterium]|nr:hypothetical protein [Verrucomicrobiales bacterium]
MFIALLLVVTAIGVGSRWGLGSETGPPHAPSTWRPSPNRFPLGTMMQGARTDFAMRLYTGRHPSQSPAWVQRLPGYLGYLAEALHYRTESARLLRGWRKQVEVRLPSCVKIESLSVGWHPSPHGAYLELKAWVDASEAGTWNDALVFAARDSSGGTNRLVVPFELRVVAPGAHETVRRVLVWSTPYGAQATDDGSEFAMIGRMTTGLAERRVQVDYLRKRPKRFKDYDLVMVTEEALVELSTGQVDLLRRYLEEGGHLVLAGDVFFSGSAIGANLLSEGLGLRFETQQERLIPADLVIGKDPITEGVRSLRFGRHVPVYAIPGTGVSGARELVTEPGSPGGVVAVSRASGRGELRALGRSLWWLDSAGSTDDMERLLTNLLTPPIVDPEPKVARPSPEMER